MPLHEELLKYPLVFLREHAIMSRGSGSIAPSKKDMVALSDTRLGMYSRKFTRQNIVYACFEKSGFQPGDTSYDVLEVTFSAEYKANGFEAYWLPYEYGKSKRLMLSDGADFMFTADMTGCSFGVGSMSGVGGEVLVGHSNAGSQHLSDPAARRMKQAEMLQKKMNPDKPINIISKSDYMPDSNNYIDFQGGTIIGVKNSGRWRFFVQPRIITAAKHYVKREVIEFGAIK